MNAVPFKAPVRDWVGEEEEREIAQTSIPSVPFRLPSAITADDWMVRDIPAPDFLLGEILSTTARAALIANTGHGKSALATALACHLARGQDFLHWHVPRRANVLLLDGEMPRDLLKERIIAQMGALGHRRGDPQPFIVSTEDFEDAPPLNTEDGFEWFKQLCGALGHLDLVILDNPQALFEGDLREERTWAGMAPIVSWLSKQRIGQLWPHHTITDGTRPYGGLAPFWKFDAICMAKRVETEDGSLAINIDFETKHRRRRPENLSDFAPSVVRMMNYNWTSEPTDLASKKPGRRIATGEVMQEIYRQALRDALNRDVESVPGKVGVYGVTAENIRRHVDRIAPPDDPADRTASDTRKKQLQAARDKLIAAGEIEAHAYVTPGGKTVNYIKLRG